MSSNGATASPRTRHITGLPGQARQTSQRSAGRSIAVPLVSFALTWTARTVLTRSYQRRTGHSLPSAQDRSASLGSVLVWACVLAASAAVVDALVQRAFAPPVGTTQSLEGSEPPGGSDSPEKSE